MCPSALRLNPRRPRYLSQQIPGPTPFLMEPPALELGLLFTEPLCAPTMTLPRPAPLHGHSQGPPSHTYTSFLQHLGELSLVSFSLPSFPSLIQQRFMGTYPTVCLALYKRQIWPHLSPALGPSECIPVLGRGGSEPCTVQGSPSAPVPFIHSMSIYWTPTVCSPSVEI